MSAPKPEPISHTAEMVIATVVGVGVGLGADNLLLGCVVGIAVGIVLASPRPCTWTASAAAVEGCGRAAPCTRGSAGRRPATSTATATAGFP